MADKKIIAVVGATGAQKLAGVASEDIGRCAYGVFKRGGEYVGKTAGIAGEPLTGAEMAASFSKVLGQPVAYNAVTPDVFRSFGFPGAADVGNMFQFYSDFASEFERLRDVNVSRSLNPSLQTFDQWLAQNKALIPPA